MSFSSLKSDAPEAIHRKAAGTLPSFMAPQCSFSQHPLQNKPLTHKGTLGPFLQVRPGPLAQHASGTPAVADPKGKGPPVSFLTSTPGCSYTRTGSALVHPLSSDPVTTPRRPKSPGLRPREHCNSHPHLFMSTQLLLSSRPCSRSELVSLNPRPECCQELSF